MIADQHAYRQDQQRAVKPEQAADEFPVESAVFGAEILGQSTHVRLLVERRVSS